MEDQTRALKNALGRYATGVALVSCLDKTGSPITMTINSFTSVSITPPLVLWCVDKAASSYAHFVACTQYTISVLPENAEHISNRFASFEAEPLTVSEATYWDTECPLYANRLAGFECRVVDRHEAGDHMILIGEVTRFDCHDGEPLIYFASQYAKGVNKDD